MTTKKALLIGINYRGTSSALNGCINDVNNMKEYLLKNNYIDADITVMTDDTELKPTRANMIAEIMKLIQSGADRLFLHYSGHGSWIKDTSGDEADGRDETLVPLDYTKSGMIVDDQLRGLLTFMPANSKLTAVFDCCHSGTGMDLAYNLTSEKRLVRVKKGRMFVRSFENFLVMKKDVRYKDTPGQVIMLSGCLDKQYSADAFQEGKYQGALTFCLLKTLESEKPSNWQDLVTKVRDLLKKNNYDQIANLTSGRELSLATAVEFC